MKFTFRPSGLVSHAYFVYGEFPGGVCPFYIGRMLPKRLTPSRYVFVREQLPAIISCKLDDGDVKRAFAEHLPREITFADEAIVI